MSFNFDPWWKRLVLPTCFLLCLLAVIVRTQTGGGKPVKLAIQTPGSAVVAGASVEIEVILQNTNNQAVKGTKDFPLELEIRQPSKQTEKMRATIKIGETATKFRTQLNEPGLVEIRAKHRELLEGALFISVKAPAVFKTRPGLKSAPKPPSKPKPSAFSTAALFVAFGAGFGFDQDAPALQLVSLAPRQTPPPFPASGVSLPKLTLSLRGSDQRRFLADGKDEAKIQLFLDEASLVDLQVRLTSNGGKLTPELVMIPSGQFSGEARLTNDHPGAVTVNVQSSTPKVNLNDAKELRFSFAPPISKLDLETSPPKIYMGDRSELIVRLKDEHGRALNTDEAREITLAIESGRGEIERTVLAIEPNRFEARSGFTPAESGKVIITAWTQGLMEDRDEIEVARATALLIWSGLGGLLGGLLAFWSRGRKWWQTPAGAITGTVFYWSFVFGLLPFLPRVGVVNSWSAFAISIIGGWLGVEIFSLILRRLGLLSGQGKTGEKPDEEPELRSEPQP